MKKTILLMTTALMIYGSGFSKGDFPGMKGQFFVYWGYNRAGFSKSDIQFVGPQYNFTLYNVVAKDRPSKFTLNEYFTPQHMWIPQYNYRFGFWLKDNLSISVGLDHMKYVMVKDQYTRISGYIHPRGDYTQTSNFDGSSTIKLTPDFLRYEHTDGCNYFGIDLEKYFTNISIIPNKIELMPMGSIGAGPMIPRTDCHLFNEGRNNKYHVAGWGVSLEAGIHIEFFRRFFMRWCFKTGYIEMPNILTTGKTYDRALQHFNFYEGYGIIGYNFFLGKHHKSNKDTDDSGSK